MTNYERIKSFTVEQMGKFSNMMDLGNIDFSKTFCDMCDDKECDACFEWWLNSNSDSPQGLNEYDWGNENE